MPPREGGPRDRPAATAVLGSGMSADLPDTLAGLLSRWRERYRTDPSFRDEIGMLFQVLRGIEGDLDGVALDRAAGAGRTSGELPPDESALFLTDAIRAVPLGASTGTPSEGPRVAGSPAETVPPPPRPFTEKDAALRTP